jgi:hypothetical protein
MYTTESQQSLLNFNGSFIITHQKLHNSLLFDALQHGSQLVIHFVPKRMQTTI